MAEHDREARKSELQRPPADLERREMARVKNRAVAFRKRRGDVLEPADSEAFWDAAIRREPREPDFGDRHAHRFEMAFQQTLALRRSQVRKAELEIAPRSIALPAR